MNVVCAATFMAAVGDIHAVPELAAAGRLPGLDPRLRQSGSEPASGGRIPKRGSASARWVLVEAAGRWYTSPARCAPSTSASAPAAATARRSSRLARKLVVLFRCLLTRSEDYAHQQPSLTAKKLRLVEIRAGAPTLKGKRTGLFATRERMRQAERELARQAEAS